jgi:hydrogenase maturation protein HypF
LLLELVGAPVVATSGNLSEEPIATANSEALERLGRIADRFLLHDRPIARLVDDSVMQIVGGAPQPLRRARGLAPLPVRVRETMPSILAVGAHLKNTVALSVGDNVFVSQHIGNLETPEALAVFERVIADFVELYGAEPVAVARDLHPDYPSTLWVDRAGQGGSPLGGLEVVPVQHHHAHLAACLAENRVSDRALGITWDGTGYGTDGTVWGGEVLLGDAADFERVAALRTFRLPGGEVAVREPRRVALALMWELWGREAVDRRGIAAIESFTEAERAALAAMLVRGFGAPVTSSAGRLFDAVASLAGLRQKASFEGQAAMELEFVADLTHRDAYPLPVVEGIGEGAPALVLDWGPLVEALLADSRRGTAASIMSARFHRALVEAIAEVAERVGEERVALTGGCFQNRLLSEWTAERLSDKGHDVLMHRELPPNDGSISFGQAAVAARRLRRKGVH